MLTISNSLSLFRVPLALLFFFENPLLRLLAIALAAITDCIDGYLARRYKSVSQFGAMLDPAMDKFFVYFALLILFQEGAVARWECAAMLSRDVFLAIYGILIVTARKWETIVFRSVRWGKMTTILQFIVLIGLVYHIPFSWFVFSSFIMMGWLAFLELFQLAPVNNIG